VFPPVDLSHELTEGFAARFIHDKVGRLVARGTIGPSDREDLEQDLKLHLIRRFDQFDPSVAHWRTFVVVVVERFILTYLVARRRRRRREVRPSPKDSVAESVTNNNLQSRRHSVSVPVDNSFDPTSQRDLALDVCEIVSGLPESTRRLCEQLMHDSPAEVARQTQIPRTTLHGHISMLRKSFRAATENNRKNPSSHRRRSQ
jgi:RNA polymerase sigma factor (sigma-70 family)